jgi:hypothetical protein
VVTTQLVTVPPDGLSGIALRGITQSTGSFLVDGTLGAAAGYFAAPTDRQRFGYAVGGAVATGVAGLLGLVAIIGYSYVNRRSARQ